MGRDPPKAEPNSRGGSLVWTPLIWLLHLSGEFSGQQHVLVLKDQSDVIHLSGLFIYLDDFPWSQSVSINEVPLDSVYV
jgi:hypothetical protein